MNNECANLVGDNLPDVYSHGYIRIAGIKAKGVSPNDRIRQKGLVEVSAFYVARRILLHPPSQLRAVDTRSHVAKVADAVPLRALEAVAPLEGAGIVQVGVAGVHDGGIAIGC